MVIAMCLIAVAATASGVREINLSECLSQESICNEIKCKDLQQSYHYLGSTEMWHIFGETLTATDGDMPFSSTYGYKVARQQIDVSPLKEINDDQLDQYVSPESCPKIGKIIKSEAKVMIENGVCAGFE